MLTIIYHTKFVFNIRFEPPNATQAHILVIYVEYEADNTSYYDKYFSIIFANWGSHSSHTPLLS